MNERSIILRDWEARGMAAGRIGLLVRAMNPQPVFHSRLGLQWKGHCYGIQTDGQPYLKTLPLDSPFGSPGDRLACREKWQDGWIVDHPGANPRVRWRSPATMPRWAVRTVLEITDVRAARVQEITEEEARAAGVDRTKGGLWFNYSRSPIEPDLTRSFERSWQTFWDSHCNPGQEWARNPCVWFIGVRRI